MEDPSVYSDLKIDSNKSTDVSKLRQDWKRLPTPDFVETYNLNEPHVEQMVLSGLIIPKTYNEMVDVQDWLDDYNLVAEANKWKDEEKFDYLIAFLSGPPLIWFKRMRRNPEFKWNIFCAEIVKRFSNTCDTLMAETKIMCRKQRVDETFNSYWEEKLNLIEKLTPQKSMKEKMNLLMNGLKESLYSNVIHDYLSKQFESIDELYLMIKLRDDATNFSFEKPHKRVKFNEWTENEYELENDKIEMLTQAIDELSLNLNQQNEDEMIRFQNISNSQWKQSTNEFPHLRNDYGIRQSEVHTLTCWK